MKKKIIASILVLTLTVSMLCACGTSGSASNTDTSSSTAAGLTLQEYYSDSTHQAELDSTAKSIVESSDSEIKSAEYKVVGNTITWIYQFNYEIVEFNLEGYKTNIENNIDEAFDEMRDMGITGTITVVYRYLNNDGSELGEITSTNEY